MLYATVLHSPYVGGAPAAIDDATARAVPGVSDVVKLPAGVGVLGTRLKRRKRQEPGRGGLDRRAGRHLRQRTRPRRIRRRRPRQEPARRRLLQRRRCRCRVERGSRHVLRSEYRTRYVCHAQMEPLTATASVGPTANQPRSGSARKVAYRSHDAVARPARTDGATGHLSPAFAGRRLWPARGAGRGA